MFSRIRSAWRTLRDGNATWDKVFELEENVRNANAEREYVEKALVAAVAVGCVAEGGRCRFCGQDGHPNILHDAECPWPMLVTWRGRMLSGLP